MGEVRQLTEAEALEFAESGKWLEMTLRERGVFQLYQNRLCMPAEVMHEAIEAALGRGIWTHEFCDQKALQREFEGLEPAPTIAGVFAKLVALADGKPIIVVEKEGQDERE